MEQYPIPQFIEAEGKIVFFLSFKQFFYIIADITICFIFYYTLPGTLFVILSVLLSILIGGLAFLSINGTPLPNLILQSIGFAVGGKDYTWKKKESPYPFKSIKRAQIKKLDQGPVLQAQQSQLKKIKTSVELKTK